MRWQVCLLLLLLLCGGAAYARLAKLELAPFSSDFVVLLHVELGSTAAPHNCVLTAHICAYDWLFRT